ncbi:hypothetical protein BC938DRAFT_480585 [Jimgerdemannia flammicorona]|uniref:MATH domain-containing protein n=1 Tax=Jimgerdemannia flammicorona TaxID=994334 RepID=A0A433QIW5_9FUNG|nr:hypothetical protein BC938DRAFT_480585 [Jimgerdemannia flammicorona]
MMAIQIASNVFEWKLKDFSKLEKKPYRSDTFGTTEKHLWGLLFYPYGEKAESETSVSYFIEGKANGNFFWSREKVEVRLFIKCGTSTIGDNKFNCTFTKKESGRGYRQFSQRAELISKPNVDEALVLGAQITYQRPMEMPVPPSLVEAWLSLLDNDKVSDVVFQLHPCSKGLAVGTLQLFRGAFQ